MLPYNLNNFQKNLSVSAKSFFSKIEFFDTIDSTNEYVLKQNIQENILALANSQSRGKATKGKNWVSEQGNIFFSIGWVSSLKIHQAQDLSFKIGKVLLKSIQVLIEPEKHPNFELKYPNDILYNKQKLAGILIESKSVAGFDPSKRLYVIGIGVNLVTIKEQVSQPIISLEQIVNLKLDKNQVVARIINDLVEYLSGVK